MCVCCNLLFRRLGTLRRGVDFGQRTWWRRCSLFLLFLSLLSFDTDRLEILLRVTSREGGREEEEVTPVPLEPAW